MSLPQPLRAPEPRRPLIIVCFSMPEQQLAAVNAVLTIATIFCRKPSLACYPASVFLAEGASCNCHWFLESHRRLVLRRGEDG